MAKYLDENGLLYFWQKIINKFVAKESGKGLSTNDYTTTEKNKLSGIANGAEANVIESVKVNGTALPVTSKAVNIVDMQGATSSAAGKAGLVPAPASGKQTAYLRGDGTWTIPEGTTYEEATTSTSGLMPSSAVTKLNSIENGAQANVIETVKVNGTALTPTSKAVDVIVPVAGSTTPAMDGTASAGSSDDFARADHVHPHDTSKANLASPTFTGQPKAPTANAGTNTTQIATTEFVTTAVANAIGSIQGISYSVVTSLPTTGQAGVIYLVAHSHGTGDSYDEYVWVNNGFEKIGNTDIDLSGYVQTSDLVAITNAEIDSIVSSVS